MASKSDKEGKGSKKSAPQSPKATPEKAAPKSKKPLDDEEEEDDNEEDAPKSAAKKTAKTSSKSKKDEDEDDEEDDFEEVDEWEKVEEEEEWDPDFDEFDIPKSKTKKSAGGTGTPKKTAKGADEDDLGLDEDFKDLDLFNDSGFDEEEDDF